MTQEISPTMPAPAPDDAADSILALAERLLATQLDAEQAEIVEAILENTWGLRGGGRAPAPAPAGRDAPERLPFSLRDLIAYGLDDALYAADAGGLALRVDIAADTPDALSGAPATLANALAALIAWATEHATEAALQIEPAIIEGDQAEISFAAALVRPRSAGSKPAAPDSDAVRRLGARLECAAASASFSTTFGVRAESRPKPPPPAHASLTGLRVLIVIGDPVRRAQLAALLTGWGMAPIEADSAQMALALLERGTRAGAEIPVMLLSRRVAGLDGFLLALKIKRRRSLHATTLLMLTDRGLRGDAARCREYGVAGYLTEPVNPHDLRAALATLLGTSVAAIAAADDTTLVTRHSLREQRRGESLLLVDASEPRRLMIAHWLDNAGFSLTLADTPSGGAALMEQQQFDLIMAAIDSSPAAEVGASLRLNAGAATRLVALTEASGEEHAASLRAAGFSDVVTLPLERTALLNAVRARLD